MSDFTPAMLRQVCRRDFQTFLETALEVIQPEITYEANWHVQAICHHLDEAASGAITRLIINQPPRTLKSLAASVIWPAFLLGLNPSRSILCISYSDELAAEFARLFRLLITSEFYRKTFPGTRFQKITDGKVTTTRNGSRQATSIGGTLTGKGADVIIVDDPLKAEDAYSEVARTAVNKWFGTSLYSRQNNPTTTVIVVVMQRLHADDLSGHLLEQGGWTHLRIPAESREDKHFAIGHGETFLFRKGELLSKARLPREELARLVAVMGPSQFSAQYLQDPQPADGNILKLEHIHTYLPAELPPTGLLIHSWDPAAKPGEANDFSVCTTLLATRSGNLYVINVLRVKRSYSQLRQLAVEHALHERPNIILIEDVGVGTSLIDNLKAEGLSVVGIVPKLDKQTRLLQAMMLFETARVRFPKTAPWLDECVRELLAFPNGKNDDQVDSLVHGLLFAHEHIQRLLVPIVPPGLIDRDSDFPSDQLNIDDERTNEQVLVPAIIF